MNESQPPAEQNPLAQSKETAVNPFLKFPPEKFTQLKPTITFLDHIGPWHQISVDVVKVSGNPADGDVYLQQKGYGSFPNRWSPAKPMLMKFADAAAISFHPELTGSVVVEDMRVVSKAVGIMKQSDGQFRTLTAEYELDLTVIESETRADYSKKADDKIRENKLSVTNREKWIDEQTGAFMLKKRKHKVALANTGAMLRVIRMMLSVKSTYTDAELSKPFAVPRVDFRPPLDDPQVKQALLTKMAASRERVFGAPETFDAATGEITPVADVHAGTPPDADPADGEVITDAPESDDGERRAALAGAMGFVDAPDPEPEPAPKSESEIIRDRLRTIHSLYDDDAAKNHLLDRMIESGYDKNDPRDPAGILDVSTGKSFLDKVVDLEFWIFTNVPEIALNVKQPDMFDE